MIGPDPAAYDAILWRGRSALAWEVLRRDPAYRNACAALPGSRCPDMAAGSDFVARWGLHFP